MQSAAPPDLSDTPYRLLERTAHGEFGSWRAVDEDGNRFVVKPTWTEDGVEATELLRTDGVPVPRYVLLRDGLSVQDELPGLPLAGWEQLEPRTAERAAQRLPEICVRRGCVADEEAQRLAHPHAVAQRERAGRLVGAEETAHEEVTGVVLGPVLVDHEPGKDSARGERLLLGREGGDLPA